MNYAMQWGRRNRAHHVSNDMETAPSSKFLLNRRKLDMAHKDQHCRSGDPGEYIGVRRVDSRNMSTSTTTRGYGAP